MQQETARLAIQCRPPEFRDDPEAPPACYLLSPDGSLVSPLFPDLPEVFRWADANGWKREHAGLDSPYVRGPQA